MPNKAIQAVSKEYFDSNRAKEKAAKAREEQERKEAQQQNRGDIRRNSPNNNRRVSSDYDYDDDSAEDLQDVMEALEEGEDF